MIEGLAVVVVHESALGCCRARKPTLTLFLISPMHDGRKARFTEQRRIESHTHHVAERRSDLGV